jgi:hypothetical protein
MYNTNNVFTEVAMSNFIVLGLIPGTDAQLTFGIWLAIAGALCGVVLARQLCGSTSVRCSLLGVRLLIDLRRIGS